MLSDEDHAYLFRFYLLHPPIEEIIMQISIALSKLKFLKVLSVVHDVKGVENIVTFTFSLDEGILREVNEFIFISEIIVRIGHI